MNDFEISQNDLYSGSRSYIFFNHTCNVEQFVSRLKEFFSNPTSCHEIELRLVEKKAPPNRKIQI